MLGSGSSSSAISAQLALFWLIYSRCRLLQFHFRPYGHRCDRGRAVISRLAWRVTAYRLLWATVRRLAARLRLSPMRAPEPCDASAQLSSAPLDLSFCRNTCDWSRHLFCSVGQLTAQPDSAISRCRRSHHRIPTQLATRSGAQPQLLKAQILEFNGMIRVFHQLPLEL